MPWFSIDDGFYDHPKVRKAGNAAAGLFCRLGAYSAKHLTDGVVEGVTARGLGTAAQLRKLVDVGLLHTEGHHCTRCVTPEAGGYVLHDYLDYNRSRKQIESARESGRKRQQKGRSTQRESRVDEQIEAQPGLNRSSTEPHLNLGWASVDPQTESRFEGSTAGQEPPSRRDTLQGATVVPALPCPALPLSTKEEGKAEQRTHEPATDGVPEVLRALADALYHGGVRGIRWNLRGDEAFRIQNLIAHKGIEAMVITAYKRQQKARGPIDTVTYFLAAWTELPNLPTGPPIGSGVAVLRTVQAPPSHTQNLIDGLRLLDEQEGLAR